MATPSLRQGYLAAFSAVAIWSGFMLVARAGGHSGLTPYDLLGLRLAIASLLLCFLGLPPRESWRDGRLWLLAVIGCIGFCLLCYSAVQWVPAAHAALLIPGLQPFLMALLLLCTGQGWPQRRQGPGYLLMALGVLLLALPLLQGHAGSRQWLGDGMLLLASLLWAVYGLLARRWQLPAWQLTAFVTLASAVLYLPVYLLWLPKGLGQVSLATVAGLGLFHAVVPAIVGMLVYLRAVSVLGPARISALMALIPVLTGLLAVPALGEALSLPLAAALCSVSLGAWLVAREGLPAGRARLAATTFNKEQTCRT
ncbi:DMT family transporter [Vogesella sp. LIG4]|uniref:DMT family transporter n=1 Tax=Vogesella sp. LIG4 TaxID=1192162 RepID=UPI000820168D|nr:DMT family transporter [Vogesella sp. LIG4]SCK13241.1 Threonine/homoserine efflux transporter RhtA [Vogesella sp. LIG4]